MASLSHKKMHQERVPQCPRNSTMCWCLWSLGVVANGKQRENRQFGRMCFSRLCVWGSFRGEHLETKGRENIFGLHPTTHTHTFCLKTRCSKPPKENTQGSRGFLMGELFGFCKRHRKPWPFCCGKSSQSRKESRHRSDLGVLLLTLEWIYYNNRVKHPETRH